MSSKNTFTIHIIAMYKKTTTALVTLAIASSIVSLAFGIRNDLETGVCVALVSGVVCLAGFIMTSVYKVRTDGCCYNWVELMWTNILKVLLGFYLFGLCFMFNKDDDVQAVNAFIIIQVAVVVLYLMFLVPIMQPERADWNTPPDNTVEIKEALLSSDAPDDTIPNNESNGDFTTLLSIV